MKEYDIVYADPAWLYDDKSKSHGGGAEDHYTCTSTEEMGQIVVPAKPDSVLIMWCTYPMLPDGLALIDMWGFTYKTVAFTWVKTNPDTSSYMGMGRHTRANAEPCLLATRGKGVPRASAKVYNTQLHPRGRHSRKPHAFRADIERLYGPGLDRLEMFCREPSPGWDAWGNEVDGVVLDGEGERVTHSLHQFPLF